MKILALSLLRLGDLLMHQHVLRDIRKSYPGCELHVVINEQFESVADLMPLVDRVHAFPRGPLQYELVESSGSFFRAFRMMTTWTQEINAEKFELILDLTHNFLSHKMMDLLEAREKKTAIVGYFNDVFSRSSHTSFHYVDALRGSLGVQALSTLPKIEARGAQTISIQPMTSDTKKNWGLPQFQRLIELLPERQIRILGAPFEEEILRKTFKQTANVKIEILSLKELELHLWDTDLLISGDTATIHMAAQCRTPNIGLYIGSADPFKTAPYMADSILIHSVESCAPCGHANACFQKSQLCAESLTAEDLSQVVIGYLDKGIESLRSSSSKWPFALYRTRANGMSGMVLEDMASFEESVRLQIHQMSWRRAWEQQDFYSLDALMTELGNQYSNLAVHVKGELSHQKLLGDLLQELEKWTQGLSYELLLNRAPAKQDTLFALKNIAVEWRRMSSEHETTALLESLMEEFESNNSFTFYKRARMTVNLMSLFWNSKTRIYENIKNQLREKGINYVSGTGKLS